MRCRVIFCIRSLLLFLSSCVLFFHLPFVGKEQYSVQCLGHFVESASYFHLVALALFSLLSQTPGSCPNAGVAGQCSVMEFDGVPAA
jgi:hypothetical protein